MTARAVPLPGEPRTIGEILAAASARMDAEDALDELARDPLAYLPRPRRRTLLAWLLSGRGR